MGCRKRPGVVPIVEAVEQALGEKVSFEDWHDLRRYAAEHGQEMSRTRLDDDELNELLDDLDYRFGTGLKTVYDADNEGEWRRDSDGEWNFEPGPDYQPRIRGGWDEPPEDTNWPEEPSRSVQQEIDERNTVIKSLSGKVTGATASVFYSIPGNVPAGFRNVLADLRQERADKANPPTAETLAQRALADRAVQAHAAKILAEHQKRGYSRAPQRDEQTAKYLARSLVERSQKSAVRHRGEAERLRAEAAEKWREGDSSASADLNYAADVEDAKAKLDERGGVHDFPTLVKDGKPVAAYPIYEDGNKSWVVVDEASLYGKGGTLVYRREDLKVLDTIPADKVREAGYDIGYQTRAAQVVASPYGPEIVPSSMMPQPFAPLAPESENKPKAA